MFAAPQSYLYSYFADFAPADVAIYFALLCYQVPLIVAQFTLELASPYKPTWRDEARRGCLDGLTAFVQGNTFGIVYSLTLVVMQYAWVLMDASVPDFLSFASHPVRWLLSPVLSPFGLELPTDVFSESFLDYALTPLFWFVGLAYTFPSMHAVKNTSHYIEVGTFLLFVLMTLFFCITRAEFAAVAHTGENYWLLLLWYLLLFVLVALGGVGMGMHVGRDFVDVVAGSVACCYLAAQCLAMTVALVVGVLVFLWFTSTLSPG